MATDETEDELIDLRREVWIAQMSTSDHAGVARYAREIAEYNPLVRPLRKKMRAELEEMLAELMVKKLTNVSAT